MQQLDDLKEKLLELIKTAWSRFQEWPVYLDLRERYDNLPTKSQRWVLGGAITLAALFLLSFPLSFLWTSADNMRFFEDARHVTQELLEVEREAKSAAALPQPPSLAMLKTSVQGLLQRMQLSQEQILPLEDMDQVEPANVLPAGVQAQGVKVKLSQLNLRQVTEIGNQLETQLQTGVNIWSFAMQQNSEQTDYFDVEYHLVTFHLSGESP